MTLYDLEYDFEGFHPFAKRALGGNLEPGILKFMPLTTADH